MKICLVFICSVLAMALLSYSPSSLAAEDPTCALPDTLVRVLDRKFPDMHIVGLMDLKNKEDQEQFQKEHGDRCPGLVHLDFYGKGHDVIAINLVNNHGPSTAVIVIASTVAGKWKVTLIDSAKTTTPVIWSDRPGKYSDVHGNGSITSKYPVIVWCAYDSWAILYAWTGSAVSKVWLSD